MRPLNKKFSPVINIFLGILILSLISLFFYIAFKSAQVQETNERILSFLKEEDFHGAINLIETTSLTGPDKDKDFLQKFSFLLFVKEKIQLQQDLISIKEALEKIQKGMLFSAMIQQKENSLSFLNNLKNYLNKLEKYNFSWVEDKKYEIKNWLSFFGEKGEKNYLVLFQDPDIPRPSGGFIGAYAFLSFNDGKISFSGDHIFSLEEVFLDKIIPPVPFLDIGDRWFFHDTNWFFDFPSTGQKIFSFYSKTGKKPVLDGIILVNISAVESILEIVGSIDLNDNLVIDQSNFISFYKKQIQEAVKPAPSRTEKNFLPLFLEKSQRQLKESSFETLSRISKILARSFEKKDLQIYLVDDNLQYFFDSLGWTGKIKESKDDYLGVSINLLKSNFIEDKREKKIELKTEFNPDGEIINYLVISAPNFSSQDRLLENYLKIYLPKGIIIKEAKGSFLKETNIVKLKNIYEKLDYQKDEDLLLLEKNKIRDEKNGIEIYEEGGKTVIGFWSQLSVKPFTLIYKLPNRQEQFSDWELIVQKQSGQQMQFSFELMTPPETTIVPSLFPFNEFIPLDADLILNFKRAN